MSGPTSKPTKSPSKSQKSPKKRTNSPSKKGKPQTKTSKKSTANASSKPTQPKSSKKSTDGGGELMEVKSSNSAHTNEVSDNSTAFAKGAKKSQPKAGKKRY